MSGLGPPLPTCAAHQSRLLSEVLQTCRSNAAIAVVDPRKSLITPP
jgi:hypothetical protein